MSDEFDQNKKNVEDKSVKEQDSRRRFDLKVIAVIIVGCSLIFGILIFRNVKQVIKNPPEYNQTNDPSLIKKRSLSKDQLRDHYKARKNKVDSAARKEKLSLKGRPLDRKIPRSFSPRSGSHRAIPHFIEKEKLELKPLNPKLLTNFQEVENVVAIDKKYKDQFDEDDILDEKMGRIFVTKKSVQSIDDFSSERVSYNNRTKQLGVITGKLLLSFKSKQAFDNRKSIYPAQAIEQRVFSSTYFVIIDLVAHYTFDELLNLEEKFSALDTIKRARIEILERGKNPQ